MATSALAAVLDDKSIVEDVRRLSRVNNLRAVGIILGQWLQIAGIIAAAIYFDRWWSYLPAMFFIGAKQHALGIVMHDATHYRLFTSRVANEYVSNFFCAFPIWVSTQGYRGDHLEHHLTTNTPDDPYYRMFRTDSAWHWPKSRGEAVRQLLSDVTGWNTVKNLKMLRRWGPIGQWQRHRNNKQLSRRVTIDFMISLLFWVVILSFVSYFDAWKPFLILWVVPACTFYALFTRLRWISEHPYDQAADGNYATRHVHGSLLERICICPLNINYHIAHHLFPAVPLYNLPKVHSRLMQNSAYRVQGELYHTYVGRSDSVRAELVVRE